MPYLAENVTLLWTAAVGLIVGLAILRYVYVKNKQQMDDSAENSTEDDAASHRRDALPRAWVAGAARGLTGVQGRRKAAKPMARNGMIQRFNGRISDVLKTHHCWTLKISNTR